MSDKPAEQGPIGSSPGAVGARPRRRREQSSASGQKEQVHQPASVVVVGFDGSDGSLEALDWSAAECVLRGATLEVLHADHWGPVALELPAFEEQVAIERTVLEEGVRRVKKMHPSLEVIGKRVPPPAGESIVAATKGASLLVVGSRGMGHVQQMLVGSVSRYCVDHAHCPVVVVRGDH